MQPRQHQPLKWSDIFILLNSFPLFITWFLLSFFPVFYWCYSFSSYHLTLYLFLVFFTFFREIMKRCASKDALQIVTLEINIYNEFVFIYLDHSISPFYWPCLCYNDIVWTFLKNVALVFLICTYDIFPFALASDCSFAKCTVRRHGRFT